MEKVDLSTILIKETEFYNSDATYVGVLKRNNITTLDQILDSDFSEYYKRCYTKTIRQLTGFISMLKYRYLGEPLYNDVLLDRKIDTGSLATKHTNHFLPLIKKDSSSQESESQINIMGFFGCDDIRADFVMREFIKFLNNQKYIDPYKRKLPENPRVIDFVKWISASSKKSFKKVQPFAKAYIEAYEKSHELESIDLETITILKEQLTSLMKTREEIDAQISYFEEQIKKLANKVSKGGMSK